MANGTPKPLLAYDDLPEYRAWTPDDMADWSLRDKIRQWGLLKYGRKGLEHARGLVGKSEEERLLNYLQRTYGTPKVGEEIPDYPESRPISDVVSAKGGPSDLGALDIILGGAEGTSPVAAGAESALLLSDAAGEYKKGNKGSAALMAGLAAFPAVAPPLLKYFNQPPSSTFDPDLTFRAPDAPPTTTPDEPPANPARRAVLAGGLGALAAGVLPGSVVDNAVTTVAREAAPQIAKPAGKALNYKELWTSAFNINSPVMDKVVAAVQESSARSVRAGELPESVIEDLEGPEYEILEAFDVLSKIDNLDDTPLVQKRLTEWVENAEHYSGGHEDFWEAIYKNPRIVRTLTDAYRSMGEMVLTDKKLGDLVKQQVETTENFEAAGGFPNDIGEKAPPSYEAYKDAESAMENYLETPEFLSRLEDKLGEDGSAWSTEPLMNLKY